MQAAALALAVTLGAAGAGFDARAAAGSVSLAGVLGSKALLVVNGAAPRAMAVGESHDGVRLLSLGRDEAVVETGGARVTLQLGATPVQVGGGPAAPGGQRIVLISDSAGHFVQDGTINGRPMRFLIDTGATAVAIGQAEADRMGIDYRTGQAVRIGTANGVTTGWRVKLDTVRVQDVQVYGVDAVVTPQAMPYVLLGNTYLTQFQMSRVNDRMVLEKR